MPVSIQPSNWLRNYNWKISKDLPSGSGIVYTHNQKPGHEIYLYDDGRIEHYLHGQKIAAIDPKNMSGYMTKIHKY